jgi:cellobiose-specific phosphotransferase system component IIC
LIFAADIAATTVVFIERVVSFFIDEGVIDNFVAIIVQTIAEFVRTTEYVRVLLVAVCRSTLWTFAR